MIKDLRKYLELNRSDLSFVLDVSEEQIAIWEETNEIPEHIVKILQKRYSNYFEKNNSEQITKINNQNNQEKKSKKLDLDTLVKDIHKNVKNKNDKKIIVKIKKDSHNNELVNNIQKAKKSKKAIPINTQLEKSNHNFQDSNGDVFLKKRKESQFSGLRDIRKFLKISQSELGNTLEVNQRKISVWEITNAKLPKEVIDKISAKFNISYSQLEHLIESDESSYLLENMPIKKDSIFYDKKIDSLNIRAIRKNFGYSLRSFAKEIGVHYQTIARWEKKEGIPKDYVLKEIIEKFMNRKSIKYLYDKGIDVSLKDQFAHWKEEISHNEKKEQTTVESVIGKKLEIIDLLEGNGIEVDSITINAKKNITIKSSKYNFEATFILNDSIMKNLKKLIE